ncbi:MAG: hypothetical protein U9R25_00205 [Chloroflexota bacterium]|nr:hypothetical protein [Chloroflexota bacterium]
MNMIQLAKQLRASLERVFGSAALVRLGPPQVDEIPDRRAVVFVIPIGYRDFGGVTADGARITRRPAALDSPAEGFAEERPGRLVVEIRCLAADYQQMHKLCSAIGVQVLRVLESTRTVTLSQAPDDAGYLRFADFQASLYEQAFSSEPLERRQPHSARLVFHLDGFLHVQMKDPNLTYHT